MACRSRETVPAGLTSALRDNGIDLTLMAIRGWRCVQADPTLRAATLATYQDTRDQVAAVVKKWQATGSMSWPGVPTRPRTCPP